MVTFNTLYPKVQTSIPTDRSQPLPVGIAAAQRKGQILRFPARPAFFPRAVLLTAFLTAATAQAVGAPSINRETPVMQPVWVLVGLEHLQAHNRTYITQGPIATPVVDAAGAPINATDLRMTLADNLQLGPMAEEIHVVFEFKDPVAGDRRQVKVSKPADMPLDAFASLTGNSLTIRVQDFQVPDRAKLVFPPGALQIPDQTNHHVTATGDVAIGNTGATSLQEIKAAVASDISKIAAFQSLRPLAVNPDLVAFTPVTLVPIVKEDSLIRWEFANTVALKGPYAGQKQRLFRWAQQPEAWHQARLRTKAVRIGQIESGIERIKRVLQKKIEQVRKRFQRRIQVYPESRQEFEQALEQAIQSIEQDRDRKIELRNQRILSLQASAEALRNEKAFIEELYDDPNWFQRPVWERKKIVADDIKEARKQTELGISWTPQEQAVAHMLFDPDIDPGKQGYGIPKSAWQAAGNVTFTTPNGPVTAREAGRILAENIFEPELLAAVAHTYRDANRDDKIRGDLIISTLLGMNETGKPIGSEYGTIINGDVATSIITADGQIVLVINSNLRGTDPTELAALTAHEPVHQDVAMNGLYEEMIAKLLEAQQVWNQRTQLPSRYVDRFLVDSPLSLASYNARIAAFLNSGQSAFLSPGTKTAPVFNPSVLPNTPAAGILSLEELMRAINNFNDAPDRNTPLNLNWYAQQVLPSGIQAFSQLAVDAMEGVMTLDIANEAKRFSVGTAQHQLGMVPFQSSLPPHIQLLMDGV